MLNSGRSVRLLAAALPLAALALVSPAQAKAESEMAPLIETLSDPDRQQAMAQTLSALSEMLLDLPLAPMARAAAKAAGEDPEEIDPQMTLRKMSPDAERVPEELSASVPQMMGAMAGMAEGVEAMLPALRQMAERMEQSFPDEPRRRD
jgi:hypothetical protein